MDNTYPITYYVRAGGKLFLVRPPLSPEEHYELMDIEREIWGNGYRETVPYHITIPLIDVGGVVLGIYEVGSGKVVGVLVMFPAHVGGEIHYHSHILGFLKEYRGMGLGTEVKKVQREIALRRGIKLITWTYDPLLLGNAWLNIVKMGAISAQYKTNYYGLGGFEYNRGIETDRLMVEWHLNSERVTSRIAGKSLWRPLSHYLKVVKASIALDAKERGQPKDFVEPGTPVLTSKSPVLLVRIPRRFGAMVREDLGLAREWRLAGRLVLNHYLRRGYLVADVTRDPEGVRYYYVLWRTSKERLLSGELP